MENKKLVCETCGGQLKADHEKHLFLCPFCGVTYDYSYFNEDDILSKANGFLASRDLNAAREAFKYILEKDPGNGYALEKLMLINFDLTDVSELLHNNIISRIKGDPKKNEPLLQQADGSARDRLQKIQELIVDTFRASELDSAIKNKASEIEVAEGRLTQIDKSLVDEYSSPGAGLCLGKDDEQVTIDLIRKLTRRKCIKTFLLSYGVFLLVMLPTFFNPKSILYGVIMDLIMLAVTGGTMLSHYNRKVVPAIERIELYERNKLELQSGIEKLKSEKTDLESEFAAVKEKLKQSRNAVMQ